MGSRLPLFPEAASTTASDVDALYFFTLGVSVFFSLLIASLVAYFAVRYRRRSDAERPAAARGGLTLEIVWTVIPLAIAMAMFTWGARVYMTLRRPPDDAIEMYAVGKQWMWKIQHPEGQREINELHVPLGRPVKLKMTSEDVIHSFFVPAFRTKMDVLPGRYTTVWFKPSKPGRYHLFCAEYCGTKHSGMIGWVYVLEPTEYQAWLAGGVAEGTLAERGEKLFQDLACTNCHRADGTGRGPALAGLFGETIELADRTKVVMDDAYIRESILTPQAKLARGYQGIMPTFQGLVTEDQLLQLIEYIKTLERKQKR
ncbi:MAG: cytochrome c oxidase subunit II [Bryobacteraceae bacterium]